MNIILERIFDRGAMSLDFSGMPGWEKEIGKRDPIQGVKNRSGRVECQKLQQQI